MKLMIHEGSTGEKRVVLDDLILTKDMPTTAGSKMLDGYVSLFEAEVATRLQKAGYTIGGKANVGEFALDLLGETSYFGACTAEDGTLVYAANELLEQGAACAAVQASSRTSRVRMREMRFMQIPPLRMDVWEQVHIRARCSVLCRTGIPAAGR